MWPEITPAGPCGGVVTVHGQGPGGGFLVRSTVNFMPSYSRPLHIGTLAVISNLWPCYFSSIVCCLLSVTFFLAYVYVHVHVHNLVPGCGFVTNLPHVFFFS